MTVYLLLVLFITGDGQLKGIKHIDTFYSKTKCERNIEKRLSKEDKDEIWYSCLPMDGMIT